MKTKIPTSLFLFTAVFFISSCQKAVNTDAEKTGTVKISIKNTVKGSPMVLNTANYANGHGEQYSISKFKYYLSNVSVTGSNLLSPNGSYYLVDESNPASLSFSFDAPVGKYQSITFMLGVDSTRNVSGAQTGALDPLNDMFWTWNSGYIMAKMEGTSPQSTVVNNKVEYHIGGFAGANNVTKNIGLSFPVPPAGVLDIREGMTSEIFIEADFDKWWQGIFDLQISVNPAVTSPGTLAKSISDNYCSMFSITEIKNY
jgi:hypothetical protein